MAMVWSARPHSLLPKELMIASRSLALRLDRCSCRMSRVTKAWTRQYVLFACSRLMREEILGGCGVPEER
jgi:hypothetical protein